jgi:hypothetical protein
VFSFPPQALFKTRGSTGFPKPDGWIPKMSDAVEKVVGRAGGDLEVHWGNFEIILPRMFGGLLFDVALAVGSLLFVGTFMWLQVGFTCPASASTDTFMRPREASCGPVKLHAAP